MQSPSESVVAGQCASFSVGVSSSLPPSCQWQQSTDGGNTWTNLTDGNGMSGAGAPTLAIDAATAQMSGAQFRAEVTDGSGSVTSAPVTLTVVPLPAGDVIAYDFSTLAGMAPGSADGTGSSARFLNPGAVAVDGSGNLYVADSGNSTIRKITPAGVVTTFAGSPGSIGSADATGGSARFNRPQGVAADSAGNVYVADTGNNAIRKITPDGAVTTLALGAVHLSGPQGVAVDGAGNVYVADTGAADIVKITPAGEAWSLAGDGTGWADGAGSSAKFSQPRGVAVDGAGNVYVADMGNNTIRRISAPNVVTTIAGKAPSFIQDPGVGMSDIEYFPGSTDGTGTAALFCGPQGVAVDRAGNVYVADSGNNTIRRITPAGTVTTIAGSPPSPSTPSIGSSIYLYGAAGSYGSADGIGKAARFAAPLGVAVDSAGNVYVADTGNDTIRSITPSGAVATLAGTAIQGADDGTGGAAQFFRPVGVALDYARNLYVADAYNHAIRKITPAGAVTTLAGSPGKAGSADGTGSAALFNYPEGVAVDGTGNVYVADTYNDTIRKITPAGLVTTLAGSPGNAGSADGTGGSARFDCPFGVAVDGVGNVYVGDSSNHEVRRITPTGVVTTLAGSPPIPGGSDTLPQFDAVNGIAADSSGNVYVASDYALQKVTPAGVVTTLAGNAHANGGGNADGAGSAAEFGDAEAVALDGAGNLYVTDLGNNAIRKVTPTGEVTTLAAGLSQCFVADAGGVPGQLEFGLGVAVDGCGTLYITEDAYNIEYDYSGGTPFGSSGGCSDGVLVGIPRVVEPPTITVQPLSQTLTAGATLTLKVSAAASPDPTYQWEFDGAPIPGATGPSLTLPNAGTTQAGAYSVVVTSGVFSAVSGTATIKVNAGGWLTNLSARGYLEPIADWSYPLVAGFVTTGPARKSVLVRGVGPGLRQFGLTGFLANPSLTINAGSAQLSTLTSWDPGLASLFSSLGAFPLSTGSQDTADLLALEPGAYTATINSASQPASSGIVLAEVYDADQGAPANRLVNLSARAYVGTDANILIGGFVVSGPSSETVLIRAVGPGLSQFNIGGGLVEPLLTVYDSNPGNSPAGPKVIAQIQGWGGAPTPGASAVAARIEPATAPEMSLVGAFPLDSGSADSAMVLTLPPGEYTAEVSGADGGTGFALVEIYELPCQ
jgi:sugar lactone lactonase YvrE